MVRGEVGHRRGDHADVDDVRAGRADAVGDRGGELRPGKAAVAADDERVAAALQGERAQRLADRADDRRRERPADDAADVVGLEDFGWECHRCAHEVDGWENVGLGVLPAVDEEV